MSTDFVCIISTSIQEIRVVYKFKQNKQYIVSEKIEKPVERDN